MVGASEEKGVDDRITNSINYNKTVNYFCVDMNFYARFHCTMLDLINAKEERIDLRE